MRPTVSVGRKACPGEGRGKAAAQRSIWTRVPFRVFYEVVMIEQYILGIWDGHDSGAALLRGNKIIFAVNEERLTRRKLEISFPRLSIQACLDYAALPPAAVSIIAASTSDPAKTLTRFFPPLKEEYYLIRRRKKIPRSLDSSRKAFKYRLTEIPPNFLTAGLSRAYLNRQLHSLGFSKYNLCLIDHHSAHAETAARCCGFPEALVITLDGVGDGLAGSVRIWRRGELSLVQELTARISPGIFFEHVTNLLNMRELEDEGKVMALANYAYPVADEENPLLSIIRVAEGRFVSDYTANAMYKKLKKILWSYPSEQFAFMAQRALEKNVLELTRYYVGKTGLPAVCAAGGVFSNVKMNMAIAALPEVERISVFPHMGDGGLALGAAMAANRAQCAITDYDLPDIYLGPAFTAQQIKDSLAPAEGIIPTFRFRDNNPQEKAAALILRGEVILWFRGRMEIGPRALGNRSILARPDDSRIKDRLNMLLKKRVWYQPFCPSILAEDAPALLDLNGQDINDNRFMTMAYRVREKHRRLLEGVSNIDGTCRPHFVGDENPAYRNLLLKIKKELGFGVLLNTSFNLHGEPLVCTPAEAVEMMKQTGISFLFMEDMIIENINS